MSIDVNVQNDLVIVTESSEDITVNVSNAAGPAGVGVPTGGTTGQVLKKFTNTNYDTYWAADASGLTSIGLSMPNAFAVSNSPLTSNGTIAVTGAGTADQYVRGDGQLANFPTNQGGGSSVNYYLNGSVNQGTFGGDTYYEMSKTPIIGAGTNFTRTNAQGNGYIASFITDAGDPALLNIPGGNWNIEFYFQASSSGSTPSFYAELYKVSSSNVFTLIASGSTNPEGITQGTVIDQYFTSIPVPQTALLATDRLAIRIFVTPSGRTITLHTENSNLCEVLTTFSTGLNALNGLTSQVQYFATGTSGTDFAISSATDTHTFNLPTASGTNRGALSSADWTTFNSKVGGSGASGQVAYWNGTNSQTGSNNLFWDAANARLGIGTNAATNNLTVKGFPGAIGSIALNTFNRPNGLVFNWFDPSNVGEIHYYGETRFRRNAAELNLVLSSAGNVILGTNVDSGQRFQVSGTSIFTGAMRVNGNIDNTGNYIYSGYVVSGNVGIDGAWNLGFANANSSGIQIRQNNFAGGTAPNGNVNGLLINYNFVGATSTFTNASILISNQINQTSGSGITRGLYIAPTLTAAADWRSIEWSNNSGWGLYGAGTSNNYLAGSLGIGQTSPARLLEVSTPAGGDVILARFRTGNSGSNAGIEFVNSTNINSQILGLGSTNGLSFRYGTTEGMRLTGSGRLLLGTTTEGTFLLDVNGTARVSGAMTVTGNFTNTSGVTITKNINMETDGTTAGRIEYAVSGGNLINIGRFAPSSGTGTARPFYVLYRTPDYGVNSQRVMTMFTDNGIMFRDEVAAAYGNPTQTTSAFIEMVSTTRGFLPPRMTTTQKNAIATPAAGLQVYDTTLNQMSYYNGTTWVNF